MKRINLQTIATIILVVFFSANAHASLVGETQTATIDIVNITVKYPDTKKGTEEYDAPAGLAILSYRARENSKYGKAGYSFSLVGDQSLFIDDREVDANFRRIYDFLKNENKNEYKSRIDQLKKEALRISRITAATNSKLITKWHCKHDGNEFNKKGGGLKLSVEVTLIKGITTRNIESIIDNIIAAVRRGEKPEMVTLSD